MRGPAPGSLLAALWPGVCKTYEKAFDGYIDNTSDAATKVQTKAEPCTQSFSRLPTEWVLPDAPDVCQTGPESVSPDEELLEFDWASETARNIGTVVHEVLQQISTLSSDDPGRLAAEQHRTRCRCMLQQLGVGHADLPASTDKAIASIQNSLEDPRGQWILAPDHQHARSEYAMTGRIGEGTSHIVIDRTFIDKDGVRWIIDYKTGSHTGAGIEEFLDREKARYSNQLETYAQVIHMIDDRPIRLGLYFPLLQAWREWSYDR
jgi:ATP-dependent exoDNAse (exonuclease V) beta subunit